jgi:hypothetical protein
VCHSEGRPQLTSHFLDCLHSSEVLLLAKGRNPDMSEEERQKMASTGIRFGEEELRTVTSAAHSLGRGRYQENLIHFRDGSEEKELQETFVFMIVVLERESSRPFC